LRATPTVRIHFPRSSLPSLVNQRPPDVPSGFMNRFQASGATRCADTTRRW